MAKASTARVRKKVKKSVSEGIVHVHASLTIPSLPSRTVKAMLFRGQPPAVLVLGFS